MTKKKRSEIGKRLSVALGPRRAAGVSPHPPRKTVTISPKRFPRVTEKENKPPWT